MQNWRAFVLNVNNYVFCCIASSTLLLSMEKYVEGKKKEIYFLAFATFKRKWSAIFPPLFRFVWWQQGCEVVSWFPVDRRQRDVRPSAETSHGVYIVTPVVAVWPLLTRHTHHFVRSPLCSRPLLWHWTFWIRVGSSCLWYSKGFWC